MPTTVHVSVPGAEYDVAIGSGILKEVGSRVAEVSGAKTVALVSDETVAQQYGTAVDVALAQAGFRVVALNVAPGETSKNWMLAGELCEQFASYGLSRTDLVVALGGGVVGDLAGFAAAVYLRGVDFVQVPTSLLAMVDSSVGGKTAVDLHAGKNLVGAFKQPLAVIADTAVLASLPTEEWLSGLAEVLKTAALGGEELMGWVESHVSGLTDRAPDAVDHMVAECVRFKAGVVSRDEREEGPRECLNYGHTLGHAIEKVLGYGAVSHGAAIAEGMRFAARVSVDVGDAPAEFVKRQDRLLDAVGLTAFEKRLEPMQVMSAMRSDKKVRSGTVRMVLVDGPGQWRCEPVDDVTILAHLEAWAATKKDG